MDSMSFHVIPVSGVSPGHIFSVDNSYVFLQNNKKGQQKVGSKETSLSLWVSLFWKIKDILCLFKVS